MFTHLENGTQHEEMEERVEKKSEREIESEKEKKVLKRPEFSMCNVYSSQKAFEFYLCTPPTMF